MISNSQCRETRGFLSMAARTGVTFLLMAAVSVAFAVIPAVNTAYAAETQAPKQEASPVDAQKDKKVDDSSKKTEEPAKKTLPKLVDVGAGKCIPCKKMAPILEELKKEYTGKLDVVFVDVWKEEKEADKYKINLIPTQIFFDAAGKEVYRHEGFFSKADILSKWKELGVELPAPAKTEKTKNK